jgi:guanine deaminase
MFRSEGSSGIHSPSGRRQSLIAEDGKPATLEQAPDLLFGLMVVGDDRAIEQTCAMGRRVYLRRGSN